MGSQVLGESMSNGFLYVICGAESFFREAHESVTSLRRHSQGADATLVCDALPTSLPQLPSCFDRVVTQPIEPMHHAMVRKLPGITYKVRNMYARSPYERTCFLDSDTYLLADFQPLFDTLDYFDMAMALAPADTTPTRADGKHLIGCTPYNTGVILFRKSALMSRLFERWGYWQERALQDPGFRGDDQALLMQALLEVPCRVCTLQSTWNARTAFHERFSGPVRLIHGRHKDFETIARALNVTVAPRAWMPDAKICLYVRMSLWRHIEYCIKGTWWIWRRSLLRLSRRLAAGRSHRTT